ncbi:FA98A protein, partial [Polypterus senegalus]
MGALSDRCHFRSGGRPLKHAQVCSVGVLRRARRTKGGGGYLAGLVSPVGLPLTTRRGLQLPGGGGLRKLQRLELVIHRLQHRVEVLSLRHSGSLYPADFARCKDEETAIGLGFPARILDGVCPESFRVQGQHFRHNGECCRKVIIMHLEHIRGKIKGAASFQLRSQSRVEEDRACERGVEVAEGTSPNESEGFQLEMSGLLSEMMCPYSVLTSGDVTKRLLNKNNCLLLLTYLISELEASKMIQVNKPSKAPQQQGSEVFNELKGICMGLGMSKPPANITMFQFFSGIEKKVHTEKLAKVYQPKRAALGGKSGISVANLFAAREDLSKILRTSSGRTREKTACAINKVQVTVLHVSK